MSRERAVPRGMLLALGTGLFGVGVAVGGYGAYVARFVERGVPPDVAGFGMTLFLLGQLLVVLPADRLSRRVPTRTVAAVGFVVAAVGAAGGATEWMPGALAARFVLGVGQGIGFIASMKYAGLRTTGATTATAQGLLGAAFTLGLALGIAATPAALALVGPVAPAVVAALVALAGAGAAVALPTTPAAPAPPLRSYLEPFSSPTGLTLGLGNMAAFGFLVVAATWYTDALASVGSTSATLVLVGFALATVAGRAGGGPLSRRLGARRAVGASLLALAGVLAVAAVGLRAGSAPAVAAALVATGAGFGLPFGPLFSLAFSELADDPGVTLVSMLVVGNAGALVYPWLVGRLLLDTASHAAGFATLAATVLAVVLAWRATVERPAPRPAAARAE